MSMDPRILEQLQAQQQRLQQPQTSSAVVGSGQIQTQQAQQPSFEDLIQLLITEIAVTIRHPQMTTSDKTKAVDTYTTSFNKLMTGMASYQSAQSQAQQQGIPPEILTQLEQQKIQHEQTLQTVQHQHQVDMDHKRLELEQARLQHDMQLKQEAHDQKQIEHMANLQQQEQQARQQEEMHQQELAQQDAENQQTSTTE